jgi:uncharacterized membrane protein YedE/YeeE
MTVEGFTPVSALLGGALIGLAATALYAATGRIAGISGIVGGLLRAGTTASDAAWRLLFLAGLVVGAATVAAVAGAPMVRIEASWPILVLAGLLVGYGTQLGSGCTSGHGICGIARFAPRSIAATLVFMGVAAATVFVMRHVVGGA